MTRTTAPSAFYTVADSRHFLGLVALVNSLRLLGHGEPIFVGDCGLDEAQRGLLAEHVIIVETGGYGSPHLAKMIAPLTHPADVMVLIDADIIVTRRLDPLIDGARGGKIVAFADRITNRFEDRWSELLGLPPLERRPYVNSGLVAAGREDGAALLEQIVAGFPQVDVELSVIAHGTPRYPFYYLDQDVLNAFLAARPREQLELLEHRLSPFPPFTGLRLVDETGLRCSYRDGTEPYALHHITRKPWIVPTRWNIYSRLLARLVLGDDVAIPLRPEELPLRLRNGPLAWVEKRRSGVLAAFSATRGRLALRSRVVRRVRRT